ncbi:MAG: hypothetical protein RMI43_01475 [Candidatus Caldarchaeum sp.]|nr:hypothetical protein [Candidatus Caldarchaeum sp.]MCX8201174.1 hypothetical protein [Candidatus Caldarchaeum sp.]MDW8062825.1 hypothetical protein [Candidatus Caldarchaeum sp.]MDW8435433.1 hypothetical protein [Candidatus Caldarchaeum sp.]
MDKPVKVEIYEVYPMTLGHCPHYNLLSAEMYAAGAEFCDLSTQATEYPDDIIKNHLKAAEIVKFLRDSFRGRRMNVEVEMVNLISPLGFFKSIRHRVWRRPGVVVDGRKVCDGSIEWEKLRNAVEQAWLKKHGP